MKGKGKLLKALCLMIAAAVILMSLPFTALAAEPSKTNFGVMSDLHYFAEASMGPDLAKFIEVCKLDNSTTYLAQSVLDCAFAAYAEMAKKGEIDFLLIPGDLTKNGELAGHRELASRLKAFEEATGVPVYVINGNHDINNSRAARFDGTDWVEDTKCTPEDFEAIYKDFGFSDAIARYVPENGEKEGMLSYVADLGNNYRLIAIDGGRYSADNTDDGTDEHETAGSMSDRLLNWVKEQTEKAIAEGKTPIGMSHFNLVPHFGVEEDLFEDFVFKRWEKCADTLADAGMHYIFTGHVHMEDVASYVSDSGEAITDAVTSTLLSYPNEFRTASFETKADGSITFNYKTHDIDEVIPVVINGAEQPKPFKNISFGLNFGEGGIKSFIMNKLEYELRYGFGKDVAEAGGLLDFLADTIDLDAALNEAAGELLGGISAYAVRALLATICNQVDRVYLQNPEHTLEVVEPLLDKLLDTEISDYPTHKFKNTLGFESKGEKGTVGDLASSVLAYHYTNDEDPENDKMLQSALARFDNGDNAEIIVDKLLTVLLDDLLQGTILKEIKIDPLSLGLNGSNPELFEKLTDFITGIFQAGDFNGFSAGDAISVILMTGVLGGKKLSDVVYSALDEYLTESQYDIIDQEFYRIIKDLTYDTNPAEKMDLNGTIKYTGKVTPKATAENLRLPSNIAVTFGSDEATSRNISYITKYSVTATDVQIVPYSKNPDFSKGSTVKAKVKTDCEVEAVRSYASIDLGFLGILYHDIYVNRHTVEISGLKAGEKYCYRVGDAQKGWWSPVGVIDTASASASSYSFFHMTDPQSVTQKQYENNWGKTVATAFKNHADADFIVNTGDLVDHGGDFRHWQRMFNAASASLVSTVMMAAPGNHEAKGVDANVDNFFYADLPEQDTTEGVYYSFDYNTAHFAILNTNALNDDGTLSTEQVEWLKKDMQESKMPWKFVALHKAPYSNGSHFDDKDIVALRNQLSTLMPELGVDIVFQGHDHVYMRTDAMANNEVQPSELKKLSYNGLEYTSKTAPKGTVYSINGTAGVKHYEPKAQEETDALFPTAEKVISIDLPTYSYIQIDGGNLYFDSYSVENGQETRIDQFAISKVVTMPDGTVIDGTVNGEPVNGGEQGTEPNSEPDTNAPDTQGGEDISNTSSTHGAVIFYSAAVGGLVLFMGAYAGFAVVKRRREQF